VLQYFADATTADPVSSALGYYFTQGVLGISVIALAFVIRFMFKYYTGQIDIKDAKIDALQQARLDDNTKHADDYREMAHNDQIVMQGNSQANELLAAKIEAVKGKR
jgi:hypothetical protein